MSKLLSCFWQNKNKNDTFDLPENAVRRNRRLSRENNEVVYVERGAFVDKEDRHILNTGNNVRNIYRTETNAQTPQYEKIFEPDRNRQSRSYPVSPERRSLYKVYSFEQRPSFEKQRLSKISRKNSRDSGSLVVYTTNVDAIPQQFNKISTNSKDSFPYDIPISNAPRRSTLSHGVDYEKELFISKGSPKYVAEKPAEDFNKPGTTNDIPVLPTYIVKDDETNIQEGERQSTLRRSKVDRPNENISPQNSVMEDQNVVYLVSDSVTTEPKIRTVMRARPRNSKDFVFGNSVKPMIYRAEDAVRAPMSGGRYVRQMPVQANKRHLLTTPDGKILRPLTADNVRRLSSSSGKSNQPVRLSVVRPFETVKDFPLAHGGEVLVAAPMIGGGGGVRKGKKQQKPKSILRKGGGGKGGAPMRGGPQAMDDYDDYEGEYSRGGYGQPYFEDDLEDMYPYDDYFYGSRGGYYDDGYGYMDEDVGRYGRGPGFGRGGRPGRQQVYVAQMPEITLPGPSVDKGKNPQFKKTGKISDSTATCVDTACYDLKNEKSGNEEHIPTGHKVKMVSSAQQTDLGNELDFICFSPDRCYKTADAPDDPNSKLRWRIIIKRGDEE